MMDILVRRSLMPVAMMMCHLYSRERRPNGLMRERKSTHNRKEKEQNRKMTKKEYRKGKTWQTSLRKKLFIFNPTTWHNSLRFNVGKGHAECDSVNCQMTALDETKKTPKDFVGTTLYWRTIVNHTDFSNDHRSIHRELKFSSLDLGFYLSNTFN